MKKNKGFELRSLCGERFLIASGMETIEVNNMVVMNDTAVFLWEAMGDGEFTVDGLTEKLVAEYDVSAEDARRDVETFVAEMRKARVIVE